MNDAPRRPILSVRRLKVQYPLGSGWPGRPAAVVRAVDDVHFDLFPGETLGIVGESGCGKSTLARTLVGLQPVTAGGIAFGERDVTRLGTAGWRGMRREIQMVFQDPLASLDPRRTIGESISEPLLALAPEMGPGARRDRARAMLARVGLSPGHLNRYPHEFSGGQCQRAGIARALIVQPKVLICDEPVSSLDVSVQAQIINLLADIQQADGLSMIFIAHDLGVVRQLCHRVLVMYLGRVMEQGACREVFDRPRHPYTRALMAAVPEPDPSQARSRERPILEGELPSASDPPSGCVFRTRCPIADAHCGREVPYLRRVGQTSHAACHFLDGEASAADIAAA